MHRLADPDQVLAVAGTVHGVEQSWRLDGLGTIGMATARMAPAMRVEPDVVRQADPGEAWIVTRGLAAHMTVLRTPISDAARDAARRLITEPRPVVTSQPTARPPDKRTLIGPAAAGHQRLAQWDPPSRPLRGLGRLFWSAWPTSRTGPVALRARDRGCRSRRPRSLDRCQRRAGCRRVHGVPESSDDSDRDAMPGRIGEGVGKTMNLVADNVQTVIIPGGGYGLPNRLPTRNSRP